MVLPIDVQTVWGQRPELVDPVVVFLSLKNCILFVDLLNHHVGRVIDKVVQLMKMESHMFVQTLVFFIQPVAIRMYLDRIFGFSRILFATFHAFYKVDHTTGFTDHCCFDSKPLVSDGAFKNISWAYVYLTEPILALTNTLPRFGG